MGKLTFFDIIYKNNRQVFYAGQTIHGYLLIENSQPLDYDTISLRIKGKARTHWSKHHGKASSQYSGEEVYFDVEQICNPDGVLERKASDASGGELDISSRPLFWPPGAHRIPFSCELPANLPNSFESRHGYIRYFGIAVVQRAKLKKDLHCKRVFTVITREDLNEIEGCDRPLIDDEEQDIACCFGNNGSVHARVMLSKRGFVAGETIVINVTVDNESRKTVEYVGGRLKQHVTYIGDTTFAHFKDRSERSWLVAKVEKDLCVAPGQQGVTQEIRTQIPAIPPTLTRSNIITIKYSFKVDIGPYIRFELPVVIGTIPLTNQICMFPKDVKEKTVGKRDSVTWNVKAPTAVAQNADDDGIQLMDADPDHPGTVAFMAGAGGSVGFDDDDDQPPFCTPMPRFVPSTVGVSSTADSKVDDESDADDCGGLTDGCTGGGKFVPLFAFYAPEDQLSD